MKSETQLERGFINQLIHEMPLIGSSFKWADRFDWPIDEWFTTGPWTLTQSDEVHHVVLHFKHRRVPAVNDADGRRASGSILR